MIKDDIISCGDFAIKSTGFIVANDKKSKERIKTEKIWNLNGYTNFSLIY